MMKPKKKTIIRRRLTVTKRKIKRLTLKKSWLWFKDNLKQHPFILCFVFLVWIDAVFRKGILTKRGFLDLLLFHLKIFALWVIFVIVSNLLKDKKGVKWYLRKRFVFFTLLAVPPLGVILLWSGAQFRKTTKTIFTIVFGLFFIITYVHNNKKYEKLLKKSSFEGIVDIITKQKSNIFLKAAALDVISDLRLSTLPKRSRVKLAISEIASRCSPAIVSIRTKGKDGQELGQGSGFIISKNGIIVTSYHVLGAAYSAEVRLGDTVFHEVYFIKGSSALDMAILKIKAENLPVLPIGDSDSLVNGQFIIALGNPLGLERSISNGLVSAVRTKGDIKLIQMTAPVSPGSSGGPVLNEYGEVVGIATLASFFMVQNVNFAVPINSLNKLIKEKTNLNTNSLSESTASALLASP